MEIGVLFAIFALSFFCWKVFVTIEYICVDVGDHIKAGLICFGITTIVWFLYHYGSVKV
jgi:hypothetical protein